MFVTQYQSELQYYLARAAELLGGPALPVWLTWGVETELSKLLVLEARAGLDREPPVMAVDRSTRGHAIWVGIERYRFTTDEGTVRVVRVVVPYRRGILDDFWAVPRDDYRRFYRMIRRHFRRQDAAEPPIMPPAERRRLWDNTVGFLRRGQDVLARYGVAPKRGLLLLGSPGNGKTMACRWLVAECRRRGLEWRSVTAQMYEDARADREVPLLFRLDSPGIILFDDFDAALKDREEFGDTQQRATFLAELDGVGRKTGVVYLFTTNAQLRELDPAMRRPGRIDVVIPFPRPDAALRRRLVRNRWHEDILGAIDVETLVAESEGYSFAELEEAKKLLVMQHVDGGRCDWPQVRRAMAARRAGETHRRRIGFAPFAASDAAPPPALDPLPAALPCAAEPLR